MKKQEKKTKKTRSEERDVVLRVAVTAMIVWMIFGGIVFAIGVMNPREDPRAGLARLEQMEAADTDEIDSQIQALEEAERAADEAWANRPVNEKFANAYVLGDSIAQGLYENAVLDGSYVTAERDTGVCKSEISMIENHVSRAIEVGPQVLFLSYGLKDIEAASGNADVFAMAYKNVLDTLKNGLPETRIYVNCVLPVQQFVIEENEWYGSIPEYNEKLKELCAEEGVTFIDNSSLAGDEDYSEDGIHLTSEYYTEWVNHMAEIAEL